MPSMNNNSPAAEMSQGNEPKGCLSSLTLITIDNMDEATKKSKSKSSAFISRVPKELRKLKESAYTPRLVSIGPLHSNAKHLNPHMQVIKLSYVDALFGRVTDSEKDRSDLLSECLREMKILEGKAKEYYAEQVEELNEHMLVIDGCFIIEVLFLHYYVNKNRNEGTPDGSNEISNKPHKDSISGSTVRTCMAVQHDLLLLENQLPFFVLEKLFSLTVDRWWNRNRESSSRLSLCQCVFSYFISSKSYTTNNSSSPCEESNSLGPDKFTRLTTPEKNCPTAENCEQVKHILHLLHKHCVRPTGEKGLVEFMPSASDLEYAGVKFVARNGDDPFVAIKFTKPHVLFWWFKRAHFEIPNLCIYEYSTEPFLRNLIAFEQCCPDFGFYVTSYAFLMDRLINTAKDVQVLEKAGVICNYLGAHEEACDLFNKLCKEVVLGDYFYFAKTCKKATAYSKRFWPAAMANLRRDYFATPWTFIAFCAAFIVFGMAVATFIRRLVL